MASSYISEMLAATKELSLNRDSMSLKMSSQSSVKPSGDVGTKTIQLQEGDDSKTAIIGIGLGDKYELELVNFLRANRDVFAWKPADMLGVPKELIEHALKFDSKDTPKKQRLRRFSPDKKEAIKKELAKLLAAGFIKEVYHPEWLGNPVLVQKKNNNE